jgi:rhamnose utilization protein RhaD (predicted bifunctional aldolase and dehydrogenase)
VHCVETIACAVLTNAKAVAGTRLAGFNAAFVPYRRPGLPLAEAILECLRPGIDVLVLGNHGLVVAADSVGDAARLLAAASKALAHPPRPTPAADEAALLRLAVGTGYRLPLDPAAHAVATDLISCRLAAGGSLYPDHVIFLGIGSVIAGPLEDAAAVLARHQGAGLPAPVAIVFPGKGVLLKADASPGAQAMARCLADVCQRIPEGARLRYLGEAENGALLNWDAEKYRQDLNRSRGAALQ